MNTEAHLALGWALAHLGGRSRRWLGLITAASLAPDIDVIGYVGGERLYSELHHALGHNVFFAGLLSALGWWIWRAGEKEAPRPERLEANGLKVILFMQAAFWLHWLGDYFLTRFPLQLWWPVSRQGYIYSYRIGLDHPINIALGYLSLLVIVIMAAVYKHTPIMLVWPALDQRIVNLFRRKTLTCTACGTKANERCSACDRPLCMKHGRLDWRARVHCYECRGT